MIEMIGCRTSASEMQLGGWALSVLAPDVWRPKSRCNSRVLAARGHAVPCKKEAEVERDWMAVKNEA